jgi:hypothetical protein
MSERHDLVIEQGATWNQRIKWLKEDGSPVVLTGANLRMQIRPDYDSTNVYIELSTGNGAISANATGDIVLKMHYSDTAKLNFNTAIYDLIAKVGNSVVRLIHGRISTIKDVTL